MTSIPTKRRFAGAAALSLAALLAPAIGHAEKNDRNQPTIWEADHASYDDLRQVTTLDGSAVVTKGTMALKAEKIVITQDPDGFQYGVASGTPQKQAWFRQKRDALDEYIEGTADQVDYDQKNDRMVLKGHAVMKRLRGVALADEARGDQIVYENRTDTYQVLSAGGGRTSGQIAPKAPPSTPNAAPAATDLRPSTSIKPQPKEPGK